MCRRHNCGIALARKSLRPDGDRRCEHAAPWRTSRAEIIPISGDLAVFPPRRGGWRAQRAGWGQAVAGVCPHPASRQRPLSHPPLRGATQNNIDRRAPIRWMRWSLRRDGHRCAEIMPIPVISPSSLPGGEGGERSEPGGDKRRRSFAPPGFAATAAQPPSPFGRDVSAPRADQRREGVFTSRTISQIGTTSTAPSRK